jgi:hypothetical protein
MSMAKKAAAGPNKSKAIREYKNSHASAGPKDISAALAEQGVDVTAGFVSTVLSNAKRRGKKGKRRGGRPAGTGAGAKPGRKDALSQLVLAKKMSDQFGGVEKARAALDALAQILG